VLSIDWNLIDRFIDVGVVPALGNSWCALSDGELLCRELGERDLLEALAEIFADRVPPVSVAISPSSPAAIAKPAGLQTRRCEDARSLFTTSVARASPSM